MREEIILWYEWLDSKQQDEIRDGFEEQLLEHWYARATVSEVDDWRDEYIIESYNNI